MSSIIPRSAWSWRALLGVGLLLSPQSARADIAVPGADGSDGALNITSNTTMDLSQAVAANWDTASPQPGKGVYDAQKWAVVYKYSSVNVAAGATLTVANHPSRAPVVWLVSGNVTISGTVRLDGGATVVGQTSEPGPGGFRGGAGTADFNAIAGNGLGPGGGGNFEGIFGRNGNGGSHAALGSGGAPRPVYGNPVILPLLGGSGGGGSTHGNASGGAGGGAILIAATGTVTISGTVSVRGGNGLVANGGGSGGAIRVVCGTLAGTGSLDARGGINGHPGGEGRIRLEAQSGGGSLVLTPGVPVEPASNPALVWAPETVSGIRVVSVGSNAVPADPRASLGPAPADLRFDSAAPLTVTIETRNVETANATVKLLVRPKYGDGMDVEASFASGTTETALWTAQVSVPQGFSAMQARVDPK